MLNFSARGFISLILWGTASAVSAATLVAKIKYPGFTLPEYSLTTTCILDDEGVLITKTQLKGLVTQKNTALQASFASIRTAINEAATGTIKTPDSMIADAPSTNYYAYQKQANGTIKKILLAEDNGAPGVSTFNESPSALSLRTFMDAVCE